MEENLAYGGRECQPEDVDDCDGCKAEDDESFGVQRIGVDGKRFENCGFWKTELVFRGEAATEMRHFSFKELFGNS